MKPGSKRHRNAKKEARTGVTLTLGDKLQMFGIPLGMVALFCALAWSSWRSVKEQRIAQRIQQWRVAYHLSDMQAQQIRAIEERYHGRNPLTRTPDTMEAKREHNVAISSVMNVEDGKRFMGAHTVLARDD